MTQAKRRRQAGGEAGFTLIEATISIVVLAFGLMAIANLMILAGSSNSIANRQTAATNIAAQMMERLKGIPFGDLVAGGDLNNNAGPVPPDCATTVGATAAGTYNCLELVPGLGRIQVRWQIQPALGAANALFITVRAESIDPLMGPRSRAEFTTFRVRS